MGFGAAIASCFNNYANFNGRAPRSEYWWWFLFVILLSVGIGFVSGLVDVATGSKIPGLSLGIIGGCLTLPLLLPNIAVGVRRLHDLNRSGWWYGGSFIMGLFLFALAIPIFIRIAENHTNGYAATDGIPSAAFLAMALLGFVMGIYGLMLFIWFCMRGTRGGNRFGADPLRGI